jgi:cobalt-zinc-cadmium efflux system membrane fusion protein
MSTSTTWFLVVAIAAFGCGSRGGAEREGHGEHEGHDEREGGGEGSGHVELTPEAVATSGIRVEPLKRQKLVGGVAVPAEIVMNGERTAHVRSPVEGQLVEVRASLGAAVRTGDVLAIVRSVAMGEARAAVAETRARVEVARAAVTRQEELSRSGVGAARNLIDAQGALRTAEADLQAATERLRLYGSSVRGAEIKAPFDGVVLERHAAVGELAHSDEALFLVGDLSTVWVVGRVYEQEGAAARTGVPARLTLDAYAGASWAATVTYGASRLDPETRTVEIRIDLPNDGRLRPGLFGTLWLPPAGIDPEQAVLALPEGAIQRIRERDVAFVEVSPNRFEPHPLRLGARGGGLIEVLDGVAEGERVAVTGSFVLKSELLKGEVGGHDH